MIVDGKQIAHELAGAIKKRVTEIDRELSLGILVAKETAPIKQFVGYKQQFGREVKVTVDVLTLSPLEQKNEILLQKILHVSRTYDGVILQLPIPSEFTIEQVLNLYPMSVDVDVLGNTAFQQFKEGNLPFLPPVVGACSEILSRHNVSVPNKKIVILGEGRLVGGPTAVWAKRMGGNVTVATKETENISKLTKEAEIIISGTGVPGLITPDMISEGVVLLDAGSGEMAGEVRGDADEACAEKASLFTPTPGGIGPITVAKVFENLLALHELRNPHRGVIA